LKASKQKKCHGDLKHDEIKVLIRRTSSFCLFVRRYTANSTENEMMQMSTKNAIIHFPPFGFDKKDIEKSIVTIKK